MTGDQADIVGRLKSVLPPGWFASSTPVLDAVLNGLGAVGAWGYSLLQYAKNQTRLSTSTDGWLEIAALDYFGGMPRLTGESDAAYAARIQAAVLPVCDTRAAIAAAISQVNADTPRLVEPFNPSDTGVLDGVWTTASGWDQNGATWDQAGKTWDSGAQLIGAIYCDIDTAATPGRLTDPGLYPYQGFVDTTLPGEALLGGNPMPCLDDGMYADVAGSSFFDFQGSVAVGAQLVYDAINRTKVEGTIAWVRFVAAQSPNTLTLDGAGLTLGGDALTL